MRTENRGSIPVLPCIIGIFLFIFRAGSTFFTHGSFYRWIKHLDIRKDGPFNQVGIFVGSLLTYLNKISCRAVKNDRHPFPKVDGFREV